MANLDFVDKIAKSTERLKCPEQIGGLGLLQPFNITNSGARKILAATQRQQIFSLMRPEPSIVGTGYDNRFGQAYRWCTAYRNALRAPSFSAARRFPAVKYR